MKNKKKLVIPIILVVVLAIWFKIAYTDYCQVGINFNKPTFCMSTGTAQDGGSGKYIGLGYSFNIDGHLDADIGYKVDKYSFKVLGITIKEDENKH